jgi:hypothetical protein
MKDGVKFAGVEIQDCHRPAPVPDLIGDDRAIQYAAAVMF